MKKEIFATLALTALVFIISALKPERIHAVPVLDDDVAATFKTKCQMCHTAKAAKNFDDTKADDVLAETVLKGKDAKPVKMPEFASKGMTVEQATALVLFMRDLKKQSASEAIPK